LTEAHLILIHLKTGAIVDRGLGAMPSWSSDGKWIAYSRYGRHGEPGGVFVGSVDGTKEALIDREGWAIAWSPDGRRVAYVLRDDLMILDVTTNERHRVFGETAPYTWILHNIKWSPDSRRIAFQGVARDMPRTIKLATVSAEKGTTDLQVLGDATDLLPDIGWSPDGSMLVVPSRAACEKPGQLWKVTLAGRQPFPGQPTDRHHGGNGWSPDGKTLFIVSAK
jgi:Tol biopolymer transport system component